MAYASLGLFASGTLGYLKSSFLDQTKDKVVLRNRPVEWPSLRRFLLQAHLDLIELHKSVADDVGRDRLTDVEKMILILEDHRFFHHYGIDLISVAREMTRALLMRRFGGASTIDMQWVRTVTGYRDITIKRKIYEMFLSLIIQQRYDKWTIFRSYLKIAYLGNRIKGVEEASNKVFQKPSVALTLTEAAEIAAMFVYPRPRVLTPRWTLKLERRKSYAELLYPRYEKRFKKLPRRQVL